jgi:uncharacterized protein (DUF2252 family)
MALRGFDLPDPVAAAARQGVRDRQRAGWHPNLLQLKRARMSVSAFAYLRGTAPMFYELLKSAPSLGSGPAGEGWIVGDLHLENFGAFRGAAPHPPVGDIVFDVNDFDEAIVAPWRWDVLRLTTSLLLAMRARGLDGRTVVAAARSLVTAYATTLRTGRVAPAPPLVEDLRQRVAARSVERFLNARTQLKGKQRRFIRGDRYYNLKASEVAAASHALSKYLPADGGPRPPAEALEVIDVVFRVAGTGSLGCRHLAVMTAGKGGRSGEWIFGLKEEPPSAVELAGVRTKLKPNERVVMGARSCLVRPPHMLGTTTLQGRPMILRRLMPQEDKLDAASLEVAAFPSVATHFGSLTAQKHLRGATKPAQWSKADLEEMVERALLVAGWHEVAYLSFSSTLAG